MNYKDIFTLNYILFLVLFIFLLSCSKDEDSSHIKRGTLELRGNVDVENLNIDGITELQGGLIIINTNLKDLEFLSNIEKISGTCSIFDNDSLHSLNGFEKVENAGGFIIQNNLALENIDGLKNVSIENDLLIQYNAIISIAEFENLNTIENITIRENRLIDLEMIKSLEIISGEIAIIDCEELTNVSELQNLKTINKGLLIRNNSKLGNFCGLKNVLNGTPPDRFDILGNLNNPSVEDILNNCD